MSQPCVDHPAHRAMGIGLRAAALVLCAALAGCPLAGRKAALRQGGTAAMPVEALAGGADGAAANLPVLINHLLAPSPTEELAESRLFREHFALPPDETMMARILS